MAASSNGPRYAPEDPTLPKPWRGLIDGKTGYLYFWNPETNITQYERPVVKQPACQLPPPPPPKSNLMSVSSSVQHRDFKEDGHNAGPRNQHHHHSQRGGRGSHSESQPNGVASLGNSASHGYIHGYSSQNLRSSAKGASDTGGSLSVETYMRQHEITVLGDDVPAPLMTFESTGFTDEILKEVRYLLQEGANVVRCAMSDLIIWGDLLLVGKHPSSIGIKKHSSRWTEFGQALLHRGRCCSVILVLLLGLN